MQRGKGGALVSNPRTKEKKNPLVCGTLPERKLYLLKEAGCFLCSGHPGHTPDSDHCSSERGQLLT